MIHHLDDPKYRAAEAERYAHIDIERRNGRIAGCHECNRRDATHSPGLCRQCAVKIDAELRYFERRAGSHP